MFASYQGLLQFIKVLIQPHVYLEIGVEAGITLFQEPLADVIIGVDPAPRLNPPPNASWHAACFKESSDAFFAENHIRRVTERPVDLTFVDGLHLSEFALRDIRHAENLSHAHSVIAVHDIYPKSGKEAGREYNREGEGHWMGDVFKATHALRKFRPDLKMLLLADVPPSGMAVIYGLNPANRVLYDQYDEIVRYMDDLDYERDFHNQVLPTFVSMLSDEFREFIPALMRERDQRVAEQTSVQKIGLERVAA